jgi:hypothetical protein
MSEQITNGSRPLPQEDGGISNSEAGLTSAAHGFEGIEAVVKGSLGTLSPEEKAARAWKRKLWRVFRAAVIQKTGSRDPIILSRCRTQFEKAWKRGGEEGLADRNGYYIEHVKNYAFRVALTEAAKVRWERETEEERERDRRHQKERQRLKKEIKQKCLEQANRILLALASGETKLSELGIGARLDLISAIKRAPLKRKERPEPGTSDLSSQLTSSNNSV